MATVNDCSIKDTTVLRNLILENPNLPVLIFCGEYAWDGDYQYCQADASQGKIEELTLYKDKWMHRDDFEEALSDELCDEEEYKDMTDEEFYKMIEKRVAEENFIKAIVIWVG